MIHEKVAAGCTGKAGYETWDKANRALKGKRFREQDRALRGAVRPYRCAHCQYWHIGRNRAG